MRLKDGHTYITRGGVKRKVYLRDKYEIYPFYCASISGKGEDLYLENGRFLSISNITKYDFVKEYKRNAK